MTRGPVLSCQWCDQVDMSHADDMCTACCPPKELPEDAIAPSWCPLRAQAVAALVKELGVEFIRAFDAPITIPGPPKGRPLVSADYCDEEDSNDPED